MHTISDELLKLIVDKTAAPLTISNMEKDDAPLVYANDAFLDLTGYSREEVLGRNCRFLQTTDTDKKAVHDIKTAIQKQESVRLPKR